MEKPKEYIALGLLATLRIRRPDNGYFIARERVEPALKAAYERVSQSDIGWQVKELSTEEIIALAHNPDSRARITKDPKNYRNDLIRQFGEKSDLYGLEQMATSFLNAFSIAKEPEQ